MRRIAAYLFILSFAGINYLTAGVAENPPGAAGSEVSPVVTQSLVPQADNSSNERERLGMTLRETEIKKGLECIALKTKLLNVLEKKRGLRLRSGDVLREPETLWGLSQNRDLRVALKEALAVLSIKRAKLKDDGKLRPIDREPAYWVKLLKSDGTIQKIIAHFAD